jgi:hypothetical protein
LAISLSSTAIRVGDGRLQSPVGDVLVPGHEFHAFLVGVLAEEMGGQEQHVLAHQLLDQVEQARGGGHLPDELFLEVPVDQADLALLAALAGFELVEGGAVR